MTKGARLREKSEKREANIEDDDESDDESDIEEELGYLSALDSVNPYATFKHALTGTTNPLPLFYNRH